MLVVIVFWLGIVVVVGVVVQGEVYWYVYGLEVVCVVFVGGWWDEGLFVGVVDVGFGEQVVYFGQGLFWCDYGYVYLFGNDVGYGFVVGYFDQ